LVDRKIFKAYDIRGIYPKEINEKAAYLVGRALVQFLSAGTVVVGRDMRESGIGLFRELARGITDQGADVEDIGMCTTPMLGFAVARFGHDAGVMISASHNPKEYNAFKLIKKPGEQLSSETGILEIRKLCEKNEFKKEPKGKIIQRNVLDDYKKHILKYTGDIKDLKVVVDYGNGVGSISSKPVFAELAVDAIHMYDKPDGEFPNHPANPHDHKNMADLQERVLAEKADLGIFYDGDADRSIIIDEKGEIVHADLLLGVLAVEELKKYPGEKIYYDLRFSKTIKEEILRQKGKPVMLRVGNPFYKSALIHDGGILAGELSGHIMYKENYCLDDGLFAAVKTMDVMCRTKKKISELIEPFQKYHQSEEINLPVKDAKITLEKMKNNYTDGKFVDIDGVLVQYKDWWFSLRMSNTEPLVRLRLESNTKELLERKKKELLDLIHKD